MGASWGASGPAAMRKLLLQASPDRVNVRGDVNALLQRIYEAIEMIARRRTQIVMAFSKKPHNPTSVRISSKPLPLKLSTMLQSPSQIVMMPQCVMLVAFAGRPGQLSARPAVEWAQRVVVVAVASLPAGTASENGVLSTAVLEPGASAWAPRR